MEPRIPILKIRLRAMAQATEVRERVEEAMAFASGADDIEIYAAKGHFGNPILVFEVELTRNCDMKNFLKRIGNAGILDRVMQQAEQRLDEQCVLHFRLDKQKGYEGELALANSRDVIDVAMKVAAYPARREIALEAVLNWFVGAW